MSGWHWEPLTFRFSGGSFVSGVCATLSWQADGWAAMAFGILAVAVLFRWGPTLRFGWPSELEKHQP